MKKSTFNKILKEAISRELSYQKEHNEVLEMLKPLEGKQFNFKTFSTKNLKGFEFEARAGLFHIKGKYSHLIGYRETHGVSVERFKEWDASHSSTSIKRVEKLEAVDKDKVFKIFSQIDKHFTKLRELFGEIDREGLGAYNLPCYYDLLMEISEDNQHVTLSNFHYISK